MIFHTTYYILHTTLLIKGLQRTTLLDYPGKLACTIFISGCNFHCPFCHNKELIADDLGKDLKTYPEKEIIDFLNKRQGKLEAVVITGGEPTINKELPDFIKKIKSLEYLVKLDTNGTNPEMLKWLIKDKLIDYVAVDYKGPFDSYAKYTNKQINIQTLPTGRQVSKYSNEKIVEKVKETMEILLRSGIDFELRTTVVPTLHTKEDLIEMANEIKTILHATYYILPITWYLQQFRPENCLDPKFEKLTPYPNKWFDEIVKELRNDRLNVIFRGIN